MTFILISFLAEHPEWFGDIQYKDEDPKPDQ